MTCQMMNCFLCEAPPLETRDNPALQKPDWCTRAVRERIETESECGASAALQQRKQMKVMEAGVYQNSRQVMQQALLLEQRQFIFLVLVQTVMQHFSESGIYWKQRSSTDENAEMLSPKQWWRCSHRARTCRRVTQQAGKHCIALLKMVHQYNSNPA